MKSYPFNGPKCPGLRSGIVAAGVAMVSLTLPMASHATEPAILTQGHTDIGIAFEDGSWDLHVHDEVNDVEYEPGAAILQVNASAETRVPSDPRFAFLGNAGAPVWVLPQVQDPGLLYLGIGAEEIADGIFVNDQLTLRIKSVTGPGDFLVYSAGGAAGDPTRILEARQGIIDPSYSSFQIPTGGHTDFNWVFTQPGSYSIALEASGQWVGGVAPITSPEAVYTFQVIPEPSTIAFLGLGAAMLVFRMARNPKRS